MAKGRHWVKRVKEVLSFREHGSTELCSVVCAPCRECVREGHLAICEPHGGGRLSNPVVHFAEAQA